MHDISRKISHAKHRISKNEISPVIIIPTLRVYIWRAHKKRHKSRGIQTKRLFPVLLKDNRQERSDALLFRSNISCYYLYFAIRVSTCLYVEQSREKEGERGISVGSRVILLRVERSLNFRGRQMAVTNNLFELSPLPELLVFVC